MRSGIKIIIIQASAVRQGGLELPNFPAVLCHAEKWKYGNCDIRVFSGGTSCESFGNAYGKGCPS